eukprot:426507_1
MNVYHLSISIYVMIYLLHLLHLIEDRNKHIHTFNNYFDDIENELILLPDSTPSIDYIPPNNYVIVDEFTNKINNVHFNKSPMHNSTTPRINIINHEHIETPRGNDTN